jgi:16S rRNA (guanine(1405)-N(7))-methyltransferase
MPGSGGAKGDAELGEIVSALRGSRKYRFLCEDTLRRVAEWAGARHSGRREIVKAAKRKLHQAYGAYLEGGDPSEVEAQVKALPSDLSDEELRAVCLGILGRHTSTEERVPFMEEVYSEVLRRTGRPEAVLDLACGLNPFAFPWMGLPREVTYHACDIDGRIVSAVDAFFSWLGVPHSAACADVLVSVPEVEADVAFLLKTLPCLERQEKGAGAAVLREVRARYVVVSFPAQSLGGREKGMREHYREEMRRIEAELGSGAEEIAFPTETFYVLEKG